MRRLGASERAREGGATSVESERTGVPLPSGERALDLTRAYVLAFIDRALDCEDSPILDGPSTTWPEIAFENP
ncbi:hypothetical protein [Glycomyces sambucus]|uniref:hypothetical protein n=1 Tax=Glycomyces sambucus TaxID=380244 RepID=UPI000B83E919|nr:hypothetical protein [Glycomyces sambucus]